MANVVPRDELCRVVVTAILVNEQNKFLILLRSPKNIVYPGMYCSAGGGVSQEDYENLDVTRDGTRHHVLFSALKREVEEETGIQITSAEFLHDSLFIRPDDISVLVMAHLCRVSNTEITLCDEHTDYRWVTYEEAQGLPVIDGVLHEIMLANRIIHDL